nr:SPOR domain-containing protein [Sphingomonas sp. Y57]
MRMNWTGLTATALGLVLVSGASAAAHKRTDRLIAGAREAMAHGVPAAAVRRAEAAVLGAPRDARARAMLGRAYLAAGRFRSAEAALGEALALDPSLVRVALNRALAQIALGRAHEAAATLDGLRGTGDDSDLGLALALLGRLDEARPILVTAARAPAADARTRQNLAFIYALEGRWNDAAAVAAQDVPVDLVAERLRRWAMVGQLRADPAMQVGAMLGVLPAADPGRPVELALAAEPSPPSVPVLLAQASVPPAPPPPLITPPPVRLSEPIVAAFVGPPRMRAAPPILVAAHVAPVRRVLSWAVQVGAYSSVERTEVAWAALGRRAAFIADHMPAGSAFRRRGVTLHRLSISGLASRLDASNLCRRIQSVGAQCFVRMDGGDRPMQWALRMKATEPA